MLITHVPHVDVHEGSSREKVFRLPRNDGDPIIRPLSDVSRSCNSRNSIPNDHHVFHVCQFRINTIHPTGLFSELFVSEVYCQVFDNFLVEEIASSGLSFYLGTKYDGDCQRIDILTSTIK